MAGWFPGWQLVHTYAFVIAVAALFYFAPVAQLVARLSD
jgi:hypothetical protein